MEKIECNDITPTLHKAFIFHNGFAVIRGKSEGPYIDGLSLIDKKGNVIIGPNNPWISNFSEGVIAVYGEKDGKSGIGYMDENFNWVIDPQFAQAGDFHNGLAPVVTDHNETQNSIRFIDKTGKTVIEPKYSAVSGSISISDVSVD